MPIASQFIFATCNRGSERPLKAEVARAHGRVLRPAFMRPQLVTWKADAPLDEGFELQSVFARESGLSLGVCQRQEEIMAKVAAAGIADCRLAVFPREVADDGNPPTGWDQIDEFKVSMSQALRTAGISIADAGRPAAGALMLDVIVGGQHEPTLLGIHRHSSWHLPWPGGIPRMTLPPEAPSRAWLKIEQALVWAGLDEAKALEGTTVLELGCAPGGASLALLQRGARVIGVDAAGMDARVLAFQRADGTRFRHLQIPVGALSQHPLPHRIDMIVSDMNLAPSVMLRYLERIQRRVRAKMIIANLKLNDRLAEERIPEFVRQFSRFAPGEVRARQLPANKREICLLAMG